MGTKGNDDIDQSQITLEDQQHEPRDYVYHVQTPGIQTPGNLKVHKAISMTNALKKSPQDRAYDMGDK